MYEDEPTEVVDLTVVPLAGREVAVAVVLTSTGELRAGSVVVRADRAQAAALAVLTAAGRRS